MIDDLHLDDTGIRLIILLCIYNYVLTSKLILDSVTIILMKTKA